ncbi:MAG TPA: SWIM zinc finger family protein [Methanocorpusculum sp.]|nr:SWIM zinc finger family protein [Methanocorpusculum sp.]
MLPKNWYSCFTPNILSRGELYFKDKRVKNLRLRDKKITADVYGSERYFVEICADKKSLKMSCTCPYAADGNYCKHMAAVCFAAEKLPGFPKNRKSIQKILAEAEDSDIREFVKLLVNEDADIAGKFRLWVEGDEETDSANNYAAELAGLIKNTSDGFAESWDEDYYEGALDELDAFYDSLLPVLQSRKRVRALFILVKSAADSYLECLCVNDTFSDLKEYVLHPLFDALNNVLVYADKELRDAIYRWAKEHAQNEELEEFVCPLIMRCGEGLVNVRPEILSVAEGLISDHDSTQGILMKLLAMRWGGASEEELMMEEMKYPDNADVVTIRVMREEKRNPAKAAAILKDFLQRQDEYFPERTKLCRRLRDLYSSAGMYEEAKKTARDILGLYDVSYDDYAAYKKLFSDEQWSAADGEVFAVIHADFLNSILFHEKEYARLAQRLDTIHSVDEMKRYESGLCEMFSDRVAAWYADYARSLVKKKALREGYCEAARVLEHVCSIEGGDIYAEKVIEEWRRVYPKRYGLWGELEAVNEEWGLRPAENKQFR